MIEQFKGISGVYAITNQITGKVYTGSAKDFYKRFKSHEGALNRNDSRSSHLQNAWNKYGPEAFVFTPLYTCPVSDLAVEEQKLMDFFDSTDREIGYNICEIAGRPNPIQWTDELRAAAGERAVKIHTGLKRSPETCAKISAKAKGRPAWNKGIPLTEET